jgi:hypothetical protein
MPKGRRVRPISSRGDPTLKFRYMDDRPTQKASVDWASCKPNISKAFKNDIFVDVRKGGLYLSNSDLGLIGLGLAAVAPLAYAYVGPAQAFWTFGVRGLVASSASIGRALGASAVASALSGFIQPRRAEFASFNTPCNGNTGVTF